MALQKFLCCVDLRKGCMVYAWFQILPILIVVAKLTWFADMTAFFTTRPTELIIAAHLNSICFVQLLKIVSSFALIWGIIHNNHMFYQPWLFINAAENIVLSILSIFLFVNGFFIYEIFYVFAFSLTLLVFSWYIWSCVYSLYKVDVVPDLIKFEEDDEEGNNGTVIEV